MLIAWASQGRFDSSDLANGTLVLNFVDPAPQSLGMDFTSQQYSQFANDSTSSLAGLVGYYQVKG
jgi:hypothetical protein